MPLRFPLAPLFALALVAADGSAAIEDLDPRVPQRLASIGATTFFPGTRADEGRELWRTNGTRAGTTLVRDIQPGTTGSGVRYLVAIGTTVFFSADDGTSGRELWATDGTTVGTRRVADIAAGSASSSPHHLTVAGGRLFFAAFSPGVGWRLWTCNGAGTVVTALADPLPTVGTDEFDYNWHHSFAGGTTKLFFNATDTSGNRLWVSDGTVVGTRAVLSHTGAGNQPIALGTLGDRVFYASVNDGVSRWWSSDGTEAGTARLPGDVAAADFSTGVGSHVFVRGTTGAYTNGIYATDAALGTPVLMSTGCSAPQFIYDVAGKAFAEVDVPGVAARRLVVSDGTAAGTNLFSTQPSLGLLHAVGTQLYFTSQVTGVRQLWRTDGTTAGTVLATALIPDPAPVGSVGSLVLATALSDWGTYAQLWACDGTAAGTVQVFPPNANSPPVAGPIGCLRFDGVDDWAYTPASTDLAILPQQTIECWYRTTTGSGQAFILGHYDDWQPPGTITGGIGMTCATSRLNGGGYLGHWLGTFTNQVVNDGVWHHTAVVIDGDRTWTYLDGVAFGPSTGTASLSRATGRMLLANHPDAQYFGGDLAEVRSWAAALPANVIRDWRGARATSAHPHAASLVAHLRLDDGSGTVASELVHARHAPFQGAPSWRTGIVFVTGTQGTPLTGTLAGSDPDGDALTFQTGTAPLYGALSVTAATGAFTYTQTTASAFDRFTYRVTDGTATSEWTQVTIRMAPGPGGTTSGTTTSGTTTSGTTAGSAGSATGGTTAGTEQNGTQNFFCGSGIGAAAVVLLALGVGRRHRSGAHRRRCER